MALQHIVCTPLIVRSLFQPPFVAMDSRAGHAAIAAFAAGAALGAAALYVYTRHERSQQTAAAPAAGPQQQTEAATAGVATARANGGSASLRDFDQDEVLEEQLTRNTQFFGLEAQKKIGGSFVVVVGLGVSALRWLCRREPCCRPSTLGARLCCVGLLFAVP